jgi:regulatory protein
LKHERSLRDRALGFLARREHSRAELRRKLAPHAESPEALDSLLDDLVQRKFLSESRFAEARAHVMSRKFGAARIEHDLRTKGISDTEAASAAREARATEFERALEIWRRKFGMPASDLKGRGRQARFLLARGFGTDVINRILRYKEESRED